MLVFPYSITVIHLLYIKRYNIAIFIYLSGRKCFISPSLVSCNISRNMKKVKTFVLSFAAVLFLNGLQNVHSYTGLNVWRMEYAVNKFAFLCSHVIHSRDITAEKMDQMVRPKTNQPFQPFHSFIFCIKKRISLAE